MIILFFFAFNLDEFSINKLWCKNST